MPGADELFSLIVEQNLIFLLFFFQDEKIRATSAMQEKEFLVHELDSTKEKLVNLQKAHEELLLKSKSDTKVLVKEVKSLRNSQVELKQEVARSQKEKTELEVIAYFNPG